MFDEYLHVFRADFWCDFILFYINMWHFNASVPVPKMLKFAHFSYVSVHPYTP